jgi:hypothetical protein
LAAANRRIHGVASCLVDENCRLVETRSLHPFSGLSFRHGASLTQIFQLASPSRLVKMRESRDSGKTLIEKISFQSVIDSHCLCRFSVPLLLSPLYLSIRCDRVVSK